VTLPLPRRPSCERCLRPRSVCFCHTIQLLPTRTRVLLLQHPRERKVGVGTARLAHLSLPNSDLRVGLDFAADPAVQEALAPGAASYVLFPRPDAIPLGELPRERPITLVVIDGTWWQARKLLKLNPAVAALPAVAFTPRRPSGYLIRRQPAEFCVSTIEALAEALDTLEPAGGRFERLLAPFHAMVERQRWYATQVRSQRHRQLAPARSPRRPTLRMRIEAAWDRLVCIQGEANAWSRKDPQRQPPETVHWVACRPASGELFEAVIAPRRPLAPATTKHIGLSAEQILAGAGAEAWQRSWQSFCRPGDILVAWGSFYRQLAAGDGLALPPGGLELRAAVTQLLRRRLGTVEECAEALGVQVPALALAGRGGRRLSALRAVVAALRTRIV
jgi:DTW domain-containing protein YfiP